ncbi:DUF927 domain-containing protein [Novosphingobium sp. Leaf2]|uniref:DUF927 domain-containing protein n=1 Tax=Novosphingobium sp. Leaf2 TaxID=1735670 RepID=UPI0006F2F890|nr:DUF927 domain-containing protein [Novosphingobium sp. Leaf2]KQM14675.1 hypothetical protein ASE49_10890 [Novosphingobium sp. Leaf2]
MAEVSEVRVYQAVSGKLYVQLWQGSGSIVEPITSFMGLKLSDRLARVGIRLENKAAKQALTDRINAAEPITTSLVPEAPGWIGPCFVLMSGDVVHEPTGTEIVVAFDAEPRRCGQGGSFHIWRKDVAGELTGLSVPMVVIMACLLPPLMPYMPLVEPFALEVIDPDDGELSIITQLAAAVVGGTGLATSESFAVPLRTLMQDERWVAQRHRHHPLILDGVDAYIDLATPKERSKVYNTLAHQLPLWGREGHDLGVKTVAILTASRSIRPTASVPFGSTDALITLNLSAGGGRGILDPLPAAHRSGAAFADHLRSTIRAEHGTAFRRLVKALPNPSSDEAVTLQRTLGDLQGEFLTAVEDRFGLVQGSRAAKVFGACYAAGRYAQRRGVLPKTWNCLASALDCFQLHRGDVKYSAPLAEQLQQHIDAGSILAVSDGSDRAAQTARALELGATVRDAKAGREVRMTPEVAATLLTDWPAILNAPDACDILVLGDGRHRQRKASLAPGMERRRLFCFRLPPAEEPPGIFSDDIPPVLPRASKRKRPEYREIVSGPQRLR